MYATNRGIDQFYLDNASCYQKLVSSLDMTTPAPHFSRHKSVARANETVQASDNTTTQHRCSPDTVVAVRVRPMLLDDVAERYPQAVYPRTTSAYGPEMLDIHDLYNHPSGRPILKSSSYQFDALFGPLASTEEIFSKTVLDLVDYARDGGAATLFAYGQTGSGKTFTTTGLQRSITTSLMNDATESRHEVYVTAIDLAGNCAFDLLNSRSPVAILEDSAGNTQLSGARECQVSDEGQMLDILAEAASYRRTASTMKNDTSSRSHGISRIRIKHKSTSVEDGLIYLVDLAGSEAARDVSEHGAERMRETKEINLSLSVLKDCIRSKAEAEAQNQKPVAKKNKTFVPFSRSALTRVLKHVFDQEGGGRTCKTAVIACVNPSLIDVGASKNTLRYAQLLRGPSSKAGN